MPSRDPVTRLLSGRAKATPALSVHLSDRDGPTLPDKLRQAYLWIVNNAVLCPTYDVEFGPGPVFSNAAGDAVRLPSAMSYSSFVLLPMLTLVTARRALLVGGPGRGKTTSAILMALLAGMPREAVRRSIQRGHPQLTIADLLGSPLPSDLMKAEDLSAVKVSWRKWIGERVKIVDEYNRIPTKTQSALLSLMAEGYAEMFDQYVHTGRSAWFLTANDDAGGGTFQVIEALRDRIDVVVRAVPFNAGFLETLLARIEADRTPEEMLPKEIVFTKAELDAAYAEVLAVKVPADVLHRLAFFLGQLDFCRMASPVFELKTKDTLKLSGKSVGAVCDERCPLDKNVHICSQTEGGVSVRTYQTLLHYAKAMAWFRGNAAVELADVEQLAPWVLHDKLVPNTRSAFFSAKRNEGLLNDRVAWIRRMFSDAMEQWPRHEAPRREVAHALRELQEAVEGQYAGLTLREIEKRTTSLAAVIEKRMKQELSAPAYEDLVQLKAVYSRWQNHATWLRQAGR